MNSNLDLGHSSLFPLYFFFKLGLSIIMIYFLQILILPLGYKLNMDSPE